ncbi:hypothetical protein CRM22_007279 [Opisthorchis felineus]|uniref:HELP domain-containing protein n=1 Tax=Opisthorchis felineus TaxID=147828 RepID=A0A4S2LH58_OPIFE|nr:hypothetical protein CRM22_007279 [Opisthorchis felineus]
MNPSELMSIENSGLLDRVADLEKRSAELGNEVAGLRNSLADCLRRLSLLESNKGTALCQTRPYTTTSSRPGTTVATTATNKAAPHRSEGGPNRRGNSKPRPTTNVSTSRDGPVGSHNLQRIGNKSASSTALDRHASTGISRVVSPVPDKPKTLFRFVGRSAMSMSMVDGQLPCDSEKDSNLLRNGTLPAHFRRYGTFSRYYETSDGASGYNLMWRSAHEEDAIGYQPFHQHQSRPLNTLPTIRNPPPLPPPLPPSSLCLPPNLCRRSRPSSGPATGPCHYGSENNYPVLSGRTPLHPTAWKPGGQAICIAPREPTPIRKRKSSPVSPYRVDSEPKEPTYIASEGILRVFLHGRAINVYLPSTVMDNFDLCAPQPAPDETLKLEWVYGYRGRDCRNNLFYLPTGEIIYFVAAVVVLYNIEEQCQRHYLEHTDDVTSIALHPDCITVATGQTAGHGKIQGKPHVRIWSSVDLRTLRILGLGEFGRGVCCISFSKTDGGARLCVVDDAQDHIISVWEWQKGKKITDTKCSADPVVAAEFHPLDESSIVTCGKNQLNFWTLDGNTLSKKSAIFETGKISCDKPKFVLCMAFAENGDLLTGDSSGNIIVWRHGSNHISQICHNAHDGGIFSLCVTKDGRLVSGGGKDRRLVFFDVALNPTDEVKELPELHGSVRTIIQGPGDVLLVGTTRNTILQIAPGMEFSSLMFGHSDEFWALASHPQSHQFLTAGNDRMVILWDALSKQAVWAKELNDPIHCAAFYPPYAEPVDGLVNGDRPESPNGFVPGATPLIALGSTSGRWLVLDSIRHEVIAAHSDGIGEQIQCISYSPNGQYIALGSRDNSIYVYQVLEGGRKYSRVGRCSGHSSFVLHLDWSADSRYLRSESGDYELLCWTGNDCRQVVSLSSLRDVDWATQTCTLGWCVTGVWPDGGDGTDVNACNIYPNSALLATADDFGKVKLFQYPAIRPKLETSSDKSHLKYHHFPFWKECG